MILFSCPGCGKTYRVGDEFAGRSTRCRNCTAKLVVPKMAITIPIAQPAPVAACSQAPPGSSPVQPTPQSQAVAAPKLPPRMRRLHADAEQMRRAFRDFAPIRIRDASGDPPELYRIEYGVHGLARGPRGEPVARDEHLVEIQLTRDYPRQSPKCKMLTPIFHPNFDPTTICVGDHWTAGERLVDLVLRIGEMIAFQAYNVKSPLDGDAAMWADLNRDRLPLDRRDLRPPNLE
jgi:ubiquitin-protein ligase